MWGQKKDLACPWLKQVFYQKMPLSDCSHAESLTLSDLKKTEVLKLA
jgi:hypothetical protein